jgi:hypothetical protein
LGLDGGERGCELSIALLFAIAGLLNDGVLGCEGRGELLGIVAGRAPRIGEEN